MSGFDFAVWFDGMDQRGHDFDTNLHVNAWKVDNEDTLDIGLLFTVPNERFSLKLYIPEKKEKFKLISVADKLFNQDMRWSFFNDVVKSTDLVSTDCRHVRTEKDGEFIILGFTNDKTSPFCAHTPFSDGTILSFDKIYEKFSDQVDGITKDPVHKPPIPQKVYLRFRITGSFIKDAFTRNILDVSWFQKFTSAISLFDFSINRVRKLPKLFYTDKAPVLGILEQFRKIDFFLVINAKENLELSQRDHDIVQQLEREKWSNYFEPLKSVPPDESILLYQWKVRKKDGEEKAKEFSLFLKTKKDGFAPWKAGLLVLAAFLLSIGASLIASCSYDKLTRSEPSAQSEQTPKIHENTFPVDAVPQKEAS